MGYVPQATIEDELANGAMVELEVTGVDKTATHYFAWRRGQKGKAVRWFISQLSNIAQPPAPDQTENE